MPPGNFLNAAEAEQLAVAKLPKMVSCARASVQVLVRSVGRTLGFQRQRHLAGVRLLRWWCRDGVYGARKPQSVSELAPAAEDDGRCVTCR